MTEDGVQWRALVLAVLNLRLLLTLIRMTNHADRQPHCACGTQIGRSRPPFEMFAPDNMKKLTEFLNLRV
jgi:hypothetical protein